MAAIVGLLVLMVYLCTNIAYKFIPDKAKKNVKRMFTRKKDGAAADRPLGMKNCRCTRRTFDFHTGVVHQVPAVVYYPLSDS